MSLLTLRTTRTAVLMGLLTACFAASASAQRILPFEISKILSGTGALSATDKATLDKYLGSEVFAQFAEPANSERLATVRRDFIKLNRGIDKTPAHDYFVGKALGYADQVVKSKNARFTPAAKYNALLLIGDLNENDAANKVKPLPSALKPLWENLSLADTDEQAYLKPAALVGITRFAEERAIPGNVVAPLTDKLLEIVNTTDPPQGRSASAHNFIRRSAARALAAMRSPGPNNAVVDAFAAIVADPNARLTFRCEMAQFIGELTIPPDAKVDLKAVANTIGHQMVETCQHEIDRAESENRPPSRRVLMYALYTGGTGLSGLTRAAEKDPEATKFIAGIRNKAGALYKSLDNVDGLPDDQIPDKVLPEIAGLSSLLLAKPAANGPMVAAGAGDAGNQPPKAN